MDLCEKWVKSDGFVLQKSVGEPPRNAEDLIKVLYGASESSAGREEQMKSFGTGKKGACSCEIRGFLLQCLNKSWNTAKGMQEHSGIT